MEEKDRETAFMLLTALIAVMAVYALNLFGMRQMGIWGGALAICAAFIGRELLGMVEEGAQVAHPTAAISLVAIAAYFAGSIPAFGSVRFFGAGILFLVFALIAPISREVRRSLLKKK